MIRLIILLLGAQALHGQRRLLVLFGWLWIAAGRWCCSTYCRMADPCWRWMRWRSSWRWRGWWRYPPRW